MSNLTERARDLAACMRKGIALTKPCAGLWFHGGVDRPTHSCALGAAGIGAGIVFPMSCDLTERFPVLRETLGGINDLLAIIARRNDAGESRESIADWLDTL